MGSDHKQLSTVPLRRQQMVALTIVAATVGIAICAGYFTYILLRSADESAFQSNYENIVDEMYSHIILDFQQKHYAMANVAAVTSNSCPLSSDWPNCSMPYYAALDIINPVLLGAVCVG